MDEKDRKVIDAMFALGGSFVQRLADLAERADDDNLIRIKRAWPDYWDKYAKLAERREQERGTKGS